MKKIIILLSLLVIGGFVFSQSDDALFSDDDLFGGTNTSDDSFFDEDNLFSGEDDLF